MEDRVNWKDVKDAVLFNSQSRTHSELSNFHPCMLTYAGQTWPTVEHLFQGAKFLATDPSHAEAIRTSATPRDAKRLGGSRAHEIVHDWDSLRTKVMECLVRAKFTVANAGEVHLPPALTEGNNNNNNNSNNNNNNPRDDVAVASSSTGENDVVATPAKENDVVATPARENDVVVAAAKENDEDKEDKSGDGANRAVGKVRAKPGRRSMRRKERRAKELLIIQAHVDAMDAREKKDKKKRDPESAVTDDTDDFLDAVVVGSGDELRKELSAKLASTGESRLVEDSRWDSFWGCGRNGRGRNVLGQILEKIRDEIRSDWAIVE